MPRHQHSAVDRNRVKRELRELARLHLLPVLRAVADTAVPAVDIAIRARREAYAASFDALKADIATIIERTPAISQSFAANPPAPETQGP